MKPIILVLLLLSLAGCGGGDEPLDRQDVCVALDATVALIESRFATTDVCGKKTIEPPDCSASGACR